MAETDLIYMSAVIFIPAVFALLLVFFPRGKEEAMRWWSLFGTALTLGVSLCMFVYFYANVIEKNNIRPGVENGRQSATLDARLLALDSAGEASPRPADDWLA